MRYLILLYLLTGSLVLSAQSTAAQTDAPVRHCQAMKAQNTTACQAAVKTTAEASTTAPERAQRPQATSLFKLTSLGTTTASCAPADCSKPCEPSNCDPTACLPTNCKAGTRTAAGTAAGTTIAMKQE